MDSVIIVGTLRVYIVINICSKQDFGENSNWHYIPDTIKRYIQMRLSVETAMKVIPVSFRQEGASMLVHCENLLEHEDNHTTNLMVVGILMTTSF
ncbi:MAG TPA: hypothetical protein VLR10_02265 [Nitrososphaeraceae archaeon]|nr:hypothetical protein [Nitrososphaeraceae archaeon]